MVYCYLEKWGNSVITYNKGFDSREKSTVISSLIICAYPLECVHGSQVYCCISGIPVGDRLRSPGYYIHIKFALNLTDSRTLVTTIKDITLIIVVKLTIKLSKIEKF